MDFHGLPVQVLENDHLRVEFLQEAGPRIVRICLPNVTDNLLAEIPDMNWETPFGIYHPYGGHRLWCAPETRERTSIPDNDCLKIESIENGIRLIQPDEMGTGLCKSIDLMMHPDRPALSLRHRIQNNSRTPLDLAAWAITMFPLGGRVVLPQQIGPVDPDGLQPNRSLVLWPYSHWNDRRLRLSDNYVFLDAQAHHVPIKVGYFNRQGWFSYWRQGINFVKRFSPKMGRLHADMNCNVEIFCNHQYIELETLSPLVRLQPAESMEHIEIWEIHHSSSLPGGKTSPLSGTFPR